MTEKPDKRSALTALRSAVKNVIAADMQYCEAAEQFAATNGFPLLRRVVSELSNQLSRSADNYREMLDLLDRMDRLGDHL
jgi:hypothetical protein